MSTAQMPFVLSQSSLQDYADCPRRFQLRYIDQLSYPAVESEPALENEKHQQAGEYFHRLVQQSLLGLPGEQLDRLANTPDLARWWNNFKLHPPALAGYTTFPELTLSAPLENFRLVAKYDLVAIKDDRALIYDWKTYRKHPRPEWLASRWQTRVYRALLAQAGSHLNGGNPIDPGKIEMVYWFAEFPTEPVSFQYDAAQFKRDSDALTKLAREIAGASDYPLTDDRQKCAYCTYRSYCDRGVRAGDLVDTDADMQAESLFDVYFEQIGEIEF
jgi:hypothetical protein